MIDCTPSPKKRTAGALLAAAFSLAASYAGYIGLVSIRVGVGNQDRDGYWMPILVGGLIVALVLWALGAVSIRVWRCLSQASSHP
jgi:hypothetical protein